MNKRLNTILLTLLALAGVSLPAAASYLPFNTNVNMNVGIGTSTPQGAFVVMNGNVGIGTWLPTSSLTLNGSGAINFTPRSVQLMTQFIDTDASDNLYLGTTVNGKAVYISGSASAKASGFDIGPGYVGQNPPSNGLLVQGYVGIGSSLPGQALDVQGTVRSTGFTLNLNPGSGYVLVGDAIGEGTWMPASTLAISGSSQWTTINANDVYETNGGNVGIGTTITNAGAALSVMNGNVGIGTWVPAYNLEIQAPVSPSLTLLSNAGAVNPVPAISLCYGASGCATSQAQIVLQGNGSGPSNGALSFTKSNARFYLSDAGDLVLVGSHNVGIGTTTGNGIAPPYTLTVEGNGSTDIADFANIKNISLFRITQGGNVGVGTITPVASLGIVGNVGIGTGINSPYVTTTPPSGGMIVQGNIGIGSLTPGTALDVNGTVRMTGLTLSQSPGAGYVLVGNGVGVGTWMPASTLATSGGSSTNYWLNDTGNVGLSTTYAVGIGTISQINALNVIGNIGIGTFSYDPYMRTVAPNGGMIISGNVGIGTWVPASNLDISASGSGNGSVTIRSPGNQAELFLNSFSNYHWDIMDDSNGYFRVIESGVQNQQYINLIPGLTNGSITPLNIIASGNVGIGSVNPVAALDVNGTVRMTGLTLSQNPGNGYVLVGNGVGVGTWMPASTLATSGGSGTNYWLNDTGNIGINTTYNIGIGTQAQINSLNILGNIGVGTISYSNYLKLPAPGGGAIFEGNVGIGTWAPSANLQISGYQTITYNGTDVNYPLLIDASSSSISGLSAFKVILPNTGIQKGFQIINNGAANGWASFEYNVGGVGLPGLGLGNGGARDTLIYRNGTSQLRTNSTLLVDENVGIGSLSPGQALDVQGTARAIGFTMSGQTPVSGYVLTASDSNGDATWTSPGTAGGWTVSGNNVYETSGGNVGIGTTIVNQAALTVMNGNVGIGTWSPNAGLQVIGNVGIGTSGLFLTPVPGSGGLIVQGNVGIGTWVASKLLQVGNINGFYTVDSSGNTTQNGAWTLNTNYGAKLNMSTAGPGAIFHITGNFPVAQFFQDVASSTTPVLTVQGGATPSTGANLQQWQNSSGTLLDVVTSAGNVGIGTSNPFGGGLIVLPVNTGNVGIGSLTPGQMLDVQGTVRTIGFTMSGQTPVSGYVLTASDSNGDATWTSPGTAGGWTVSGNNVYETSGGNVGIGTTIVSQAALTVMNGNVGIGTWLPRNPMQIVGIGTLNPGSGLTITNGNVGIGTWLPSGYVTVENANYNSNMFILNNGTTGLPLAYPNAYTPTLVVNDGELTGSRPLWFGYKNAAVWDSFVTLGACGAFTQMCLDLGTNATINSSIVSSAANLAIGGTNFKAGLLPGFSADDGNAANIYFGNTGNTLIPNGSVGIGTVSPTGALEIEGGNVGIGTWTTGGGQLIVSTRNGNVGIGSSAPGQALDVNGTVRTTGFTLNLNPNAGFVLVGNGVGVGTWMPASTLTAGGGTNYWLNDTTGNVGISTAYAVGIGTTFVGGTGEAALSVMNGNVGIGTWVPGGALVVMGGNVGIGTAVPQFPLDAVNTSNTQLIRLRDDLGDYVGFGTQGNLNNFAFLGGTNLNLAATIETAGIFVGGTYFVPPSNDVIVATGGNVGIGTGSTPVSQLNVNGGVSIGTTSTNLAYISGNAAPSGGLIVQGNVGIGTFNPFDGNLIVNGGGNVGIGSLAPGTALDVNGTARMTGFTLTGNGAAAGNIMVSSAVGVGTWMSTTTLPVGSLTVETPGDVTYYSTTNSLAGGSGFQTNGTNVGIGTSNFTNASLQIVGNIGIGTVANGDKFIMSLPTNGGMIIEGNVGIGTWAPTKSLSITGDTYHNGNIGIGTSITNVSALSVMNGNVGIGTWAPSDTFQVGKFSSSSSGFEIDINGNVGMGTTITSNASLSVMNGNVGIGTWVPSQSVSVNGAINTLGNTSNSYLNSTGGNVGIGSTNPGQTLDVNGRVRSVGIGTTVPEPACLKADGTIGYYSTPTWQGVCS